MRIWKRIVAAALVFCMLFTFTGCRYSDTLEQLIYRAVDEGFIELDPPFEMANNNPESEEENDSLPDMTTDEDSSRQSDPLEAGIVTWDGEDADEDASVGFRVEYDESGESLGVSATDTGSVTEASESVQTIPSTAEADAETAESGVDNQTGDGGEDETAANTETDKQVVDDYGNQVTLEMSGTVAATGELAVMVSMLGAGDRLLATDEETLELASSNSVFSDLSGAEAVWSGDGSAGLSADDLARLIAILPDVVLETSGSTCLSDEDVSALKAAGIDYQVLPALTSLSNIETVVTSLGTILGDRSSEGGSDAPALAAAYVSWADAAVSDAERAVSGSDPMYTLYVSGWDADCTVTLSNSGSLEKSWTGCAVVENFSCQRTRLLTDLLSSANVTNTASKQWGTSSAEILCYETPIRYRYGSCSLSGSKGYDTELHIAYLQGTYDVDIGDGDTDTVSYSLGLDNFPLVIAANADVKGYIEASKEEEYGQWSVYGHINDGTGNFNSDAFLDSNGKFVSTQISGDYEVVVNPDGFRSWTEGSCESVLETVWAVWQIAGAMSKEEVSGYIKDFYSTFYGYELSSAEIEEILAGS
ncbi:MAG: hypothetical protein LIO75_08810 [Lachnospiraceae bacterium]|nr:hypothetical protein [Lachnospiraceae bacterium]